MQSLGCIFLCLSTFWIEYYRFIGVPRIPETPIWELTQGISTSIHLKALDLSRFTSFPLYMYWRNRVHGEVDTSQFRLVGWQFEIGTKLGPIEFYIGHHSQHILDAAHPWMRFPVQDHFGTRIILIEDK